MKKSKKLILLMIIVLILIIVVVCIYYKSLDSDYYETTAEYLDFNSLSYVETTTNEICNMSEKSRPKEFVITGKIIGLQKNVSNVKTGEKMTIVDFEEGWTVIFTLDESYLGSYNEVAVNKYKATLNNLKEGNIVSISANIDYLQCDKALTTKFITLRGNGLDPIRIIK